MANLRRLGVTPHVVQNQKNRCPAIGAVAELVGIEGGVVSGVLNPDIAGVGAPARE